MGAVKAMVPRLAATEALHSRHSFPRQPARLCRVRAAYTRGVTTSSPATAAKES